jgi:hypothetical protein
MNKPLAIVFGLVLVSGLLWLAVYKPMKFIREEPMIPSGPSAREAPGGADIELPAQARPVAPTNGYTGDPASDDADTWELIEYGDFVNIREYRRNCETVLHFLGAGEGDEVTTCERRFEIDHPYALFTDAQLLQIASTDGEAAFILAHRQLFPAEPDGTRNVEAGVNNLLDAMIRGAESQALDLMLDESVFSPHTNLRSFLLWSMVGEQLDIASPEQIERMRKFERASTLTDIDSIEQKAAEIAGLLREQRLIVLGTEF